MELRHLRYFVTVAEELHFGRAAARLSVVQPALSQQIQRLEEELGVLLLARTKRRVLLTAAGAAFLEEARRTLANADTAVRAAQRAAAGQVGRLRVGYVDLAMWGVLPQLLQRFAERVPQADLALTELHRESLRGALERGDLDVAFFTLRDTDRGCTGKLLMSDTLVAAVPKRHPLAKRRRIPIASLADEPWVLFPAELKTQYRELVIGTCAKAGFMPRVVQEARQLHTVTALVSGGVGVTLLPGVVARAARAGVAFRPLTGVAPRLPMHVAWPIGELSPVAQRFVDLAREVSREYKA